MHGGGKQHYNWKLDDERRKRSAQSSGQPLSTSIHNNNPTNYTHEKPRAGIENYD